MNKYIDIRLIKILIAFYSAVSLISLFKISYIKLKGLGFLNLTWSSILIEIILIDFIVVVIFMIIIAMTSKVMIIRKLNWKYIILIHLFFSILFGLFIYFFQFLFHLLLGEINLSKTNLSEYFPGIISTIDLNFLVYICMISIIYSYYYFLKIQITESERNKLDSQLKNAKLNILKHKIHPHFLFNTLNTISSLVVTDSKLAQNTIADFGDLLRDLLSLNDTSLITVKEEISISKRYLDIMDLRFSDHLSVDISIDSKIEKELIPSLILLPIIENSIKHGYSYNYLNLEIKLAVFKKNKKIIIYISNNGVPLKKDAIKYNNGLTDTIERLNLLYKNNYTFTMKNLEEDKGIFTEIILPCVS